jgi:phage terminase large subunit-like protein
VAQAAVLIGVRIAPGADAVDADAVRRDLLAKDKSTERIDGIVATIMAVGRALVAQEEPQPEYSPFFV